MVLHPKVNLSAKFAELSGNREKDRNNLRKIVIDSFIKEKAGYGTGADTSKYKYVVETLSSGDKVCLTRPAVLSKGFDFVIHVENIVFMNGKDNPKHEDITKDLKQKKQSNRQTYIKLLNAIEDVFICKDPDEIYPNYENDFRVFKQGLLPEAILKVVKWFFIEQDIRFWNWSGRSMFNEWNQKHLNEYSYIEGQTGLERRERNPPEADRARTLKLPVVGIFYLY